MVLFNRCVSTSSRRGQQLRSMVRELNFIISGHTAVLGVAPAYSLLERDLLSMLPTFKNLYQLRVNTFAPAISRSGQKALSSAQMPKIRSLIVDYRGEPPDRSHHIYFDFLGSMPSVDRTMLVGKGTYMWPSHREGDPPEPPRVRLKELRVDSRHSQPAVKGRDLAWLISHSPRTLEILHLYDLVLEPSMAGFIQSLATQLQSLHISSSRQSDLIELPAWVKRMTKLKELVIRNDIASAECFRVLTDFTRLMEVLPPSVQHLGFAVDSEQGVSLVHSEIEKWNLRHRSKLSLLTLVLTSDRWFNEVQITSCVHRLRLFRYTDQDVAFAFLSPMTPAVTHPRIMTTAIRGAMISAQEEQGSKKSDGGALGRLRRMVNRD